jgi:hypothetical protein
MTIKIELEGNQYFQASGKTNASTTVETATENYPTRTRAPFGGAHTKKTNK